MRELDLGLKFNNLTNEGGEAIGKALARLTKLRALTVNVAGKNFAYTGSKQISLALKQMTQLEDVRLDYETNLLTYQVVPDLN